jgi:hypothetical protein
MVTPARADATSARAGTFRKRGIRPASTSGAGVTVAVRAARANNGIIPGEPKP